MAWTAPHTWAANELVTETLLNTHLKDNLIALKDPPSGITYHHGADITISSTSFANVHSSLEQTIQVAGTKVLVGFSGACRPNTDLNRRLYFNISVDGTDYFPDDGLFACGNGGITNSLDMVFPVCFAAWLTVTPGSRIFRLRAKVNASGYTLYAFTTSSYATHAGFWVREVS